MLRDHPDDLASWSAYGEWLTEQGDARGALIELEQRRARARAADRGALDREIAAFVRTHTKSWDAALPPGVTAVERRYGFATKIAVTWSDDDAPMVIAQAVRDPFVTALRIAPDDHDEEQLRLDSGWNDTLPLSVEDPGVLATLDIGRLVELDLSYLRIGALGGKALAVSAYLRAENSDAIAATGRIETLDLRYGALGDDGVAALAGSRSFGGVRRLCLQNNGLTAAGVRALHGFARLEELDLRYNEIGEEGAEALLAAPFAGSLRRLLLYRTDVGDGGAKALAQAPQLPPVLRSFWRSV